MESQKTNIIFVISLVALTFAIYQKIMLMPFVQDDWGLVYAFATIEPWSLLKAFFQYENKLFYRPLPQSYLLFLYHIFGDNPLTFHLFKIFLHIVNSCLVAFILGAVLRDRLLGYAAALIYAAAVAIHLDPLIWMVGVYDVLGAFFFLSALLLFVKKRVVASAGFFFLGCLSKEATLILPVIFFAYILLCYLVDGYHKIKFKSYHYLVFFGVIGAVLFIKLHGQSVSELPSTHPYFLGLTGKHVFKNIYSYSGWMVQAFFPFMAGYKYLGKYVLSAEVVFCVVAISASWYRYRQKSYIFQLLFLLVWLVAGLLPVIFLPNHTYRNYAAFALPAFIALQLLLVKFIIQFFTGKEKFVFTCYAVMVLVAATGSIVLGNKALGGGIKNTVFRDGVNGLIRRTAFVDIVKRGLLEQVPQIEDHSVILLEKVDLWSFEKEKAIWYWYKNNTIRVFSLADLKFDGEKPYIDNPTESQLEIYVGSNGKKVYLDPTRTFIFRIAGEQLEKIPLIDLESAQSAN